MDTRASMALYPPVLGVSPDRFGRGLLKCSADLLLQCHGNIDAHTASASALGNQTAVATGTAALQRAVASTGEAVATMGKAVAFHCCSYQHIQACGRLECTVTFGNTFVQAC